ncbi:MAG: hypothetical protein KGH72_06050 [Candidatus Micrarchaeota archaeon]|nr:hypothetical protein [Candidatus Micrarchaeota archaeon]
MSKTITIRNVVYDQLAKRKQRGESFSEFFTRLLEQDRPIEALERLRGSIEFKNPKEKAKLLAEIRAKRSERRY